MSCVIPYGSRSLPFTLVFQKTDEIRFTVLPDRSVEVVAPEGKSLDAIKDRVRKRAKWICDQQRRFDQFARQSVVKRYVSGESHRYLGRQYRLRIVEEEPFGVSMSRPNLRVAVRNRKDAREVRRRLDAWYRQRAQVRFGERFEVCLKNVARYGINSDGFRLRRMPKRWGSCTREGTILLNPELVKVPIDCLDYVIFHELCHLREFEHSGKFYDLLTLVCSDWERRKRRLERAEL